MEVNYPWRTRSLTTLTTLMVSGLILLMLRPLSLEHEYELRRSHENVEGKYLETIARRSELSRRPSHRKRSAPRKSGGRGASKFMPGTQSPRAFPGEDVSHAAVAPSKCTGR